MSMMMRRQALLNGGVGLLAVAAALSGAPARAQQAAPTTPSAPQAPPEAPAPDAAQSGQGDEVVVTGTLFRGPALTPSPVSVISTQQLDQRGLNTISDAIQQIPSNNGPALTNSFTANGAFAAGASAVSLRGLSTNSTLVLFDGLRAAYYPLSDDGTRNFVDLNTIPDDIIERVETLRDGASSTYGADAIAGVVNIITKRQFKGVGARAEAGISDRGDAAQYRASLTLGIGDIGAKGYNAYISGFYYRSEQLFNRDRPYPYNSDDQRNICFNGNCGPNNVIGGLDANGAYTGFPLVPPVGATLYLRPFDATNTTAQGRYQLVGNCYRGTPYNLTAADLAGDPRAPTTVCQEDLTQNYGVISPTIERYGFSGRFTADVGGRAEVYAEFNFIQSISQFSGGPAQIYARANAGIDFPQFSTRSSGGALAAGSGPLTLPIFVCPERANCATSPNRRLNPNNPFAAQGQLAQAIGRLQDVQEFNETRNRAFRGAFGIKGTIGERWNWNLQATGMLNDLRTLNRGYVYIQNLLNVVADGSYNFVNPALNTQATRDYISPDQIINSTSELYQVDGSISGRLFDLPGGPLNVAVGGAWRYEAIDAPSQNPDTNGPTQRYFVLNAFGARGNRDVVAGYYEINAPIFDQLTVNHSGRYDSYSSGQSAYSPKVGVKITPWKPLTLRATWSRGFRIPSFGEANALPTTGFVSVNSGTFPNSYLQQFGNGCSQATFTACTTYIRQATYGLTTLATPNLGPERSRSITAGVVFQPIRDWSISVDYYNIRKTGVITSLTPGVALAAYYGGQPTPAGYTVIPDTADPNNPNVLPRIAFIQSNYVNANSQFSEGLDFELTGRARAFGITWSTLFNATYILELSTSFPDGTTEQYAGTLGNFNLTAGSGTPRLRGYWQNSFDFGDGFNLTATANYFDGYNLSAEDQGVLAGSGGLNPGYVPNDVPAYVTLDLVGQVRVNDKFTFYTNILNVLDELPPIDPVIYGAHLYNAVQGGTGIYGRYFRAGVKFGF